MGRKKKKIPKRVFDHIHNANYWLSAAQKLSRGNLNGVRIFLLLTAWENIKLAKEVLHHWIQKTKPPKELWKSHEYKLQGVHKQYAIVQVSIDSNGKATPKYYWTGPQLNKLLQDCRYGLSAGDSKNLFLYFEKGWDTRDFERGVINRIGWEETLIEALQELRKNT